MQIIVNKSLYCDQSNRHLPINIFLCSHPMYCNFILLLFISIFINDTYEYDTYTAFDNNATNRCVIHRVNSS
jgi:hypothetical protein